MEEIGLEPDAPSAGPSRTQGSHTDNGSDSGDEAAPDYSQISSLAAKALQQGANSQTFEETIAPFIPKRGEKDFEPTGFEAQARALEKSRKAMFDVIRCERVVGSKNVSIATWEPSLNRAVVELARGALLSSMGVSCRVKVLRDGRDEDLERAHHPDRQDWEVDGVWKEGKFFEKTRSRLELLPEEALFLVERGSLECRMKVRGTQRKQSGRVVEKIDYDVDSNGTKDWVPMSVQQAFATMLFQDELTREKYQLYAYLKRLGYVVQRKSVTESLRSSAALKRGQNVGNNTIETQGVIADHQHPLKLVTVVDVLLYPLRRIFQVGLHSLQPITSFFVSTLQWLRSAVSRSTSNKQIDSMGRGLLGIGGKKWDRYDEVFDRLRIVPSGHDQPLRPRLSTSTQSNDKVPDIFFYAWRPATRFKKTDPPLPEYRIAVVDARSTSLLSLFAFADLLDQVPIPLTNEDFEELDEDEQREWKRAQEEKKRNDESYGKGAVKKLKANKAALEKERWEHRQSQLTLLERMRARAYALVRQMIVFVRFINHIYTLLPPGCAANRPARRAIYSGPPRQRPVNVFPPLKIGRRNVIVAVNDCGTTSLLRFGEAEFDRWKLAGSKS